MNRGQTKAGLGRLSASLLVFGSRPAGAGPAPDQSCWPRPPHGPSAAPCWPDPPAWPASCWPPGRA
jgi:hypothetical protein